MGPRARKMLAEALRLAADALDVWEDQDPPDKDQDPPPEPVTGPGPRPPTESEKRESRRRLARRGLL